jgi:hypothetical protein
MEMYKRPIFSTLETRILEKRKFIQVLAGPRQTGKTTMARQLMAELDTTSHYSTADEPALKGPAWIEQQWEAARIKAGKKPGLLILDEIHKIAAWPETVKRLWDEDSAENRHLHVILLGSAPLLIQDGLTESLAGRFEVIPVTHWSFAEMRDAFGWKLETYICYGGYPGSAELIHDEERWSRYIMDSLVEMTLSKDILMMKRVDKPALLRRLFDLACSYSGQILSYQKMVGQLHDAGNTTTLAHYLHLLDMAGLIKGLQKFSGKTVRQRASSPKLIVLNMAFMTAQQSGNIESMQKNPELWGRLVESTVGATLVNIMKSRGGEVFYWAGNNREVDFVIQYRDRLTAIEVKSGARKTSLPGMEEFAGMYPQCRKLLVGAQGIPLEQFLADTESIIL